MPTGKKLHLVLLHCGIPRSVYLLSDIDSLSFTLIHFSIIISLINSIIRLFSCSNVSFLLIIVVGFLNIEEDCKCFLLSSETIKNFCCYFLYRIYCVYLFSKAKLLSSVFSSSLLTHLTLLFIYSSVFFYLVYNFGSFNFIIHITGIFYCFFFRTNKVLIQKIVNTFIKHVVLKIDVYKYWFQSLFFME